MKQDLNPDLTSADQIAGRSAAAAGAPVACTPPTIDGVHQRATRLRHRVGLAAAIVAGAGSIGLGADLASATPVPERLSSSLGLVSTDDPGNGDGSSADTADAPDTPATDSTDSSDTDAATLDGTATDDGDQATDQDAAYSAADQQQSATQDDATDQTTPSQGTTGTDSASTGDLQQGWDGSVYWFRNAGGEWRYTSHRDIYLDRIGSAHGTAGNRNDSAATEKSDSRAGQRAAKRGSVEAAVKFATAQLGKPFVWGGNGPNGYDCSGLTHAAFRHAGISLPRIANDQYGATTPVSASRKRRGDLLFWSYDGSVRGIHHVAIYLGNNHYIEAAHPGTYVRISTLNSGYFPTFIGRV
ncbi:C40 family peptidase [Kitasatospora kifunensis]|uniref:Cell wall-associated NlpC family hydrolase n=1 Tax=Kitasatospora kifunensis TaxID=58351 RepID=A0A7W7VWM9_KITKI|nr:C40 family peptidase [Kitasatospora kifunensis]MBB4925677.1 cell wall-associated NlpC family hydrolase [Kitasatospora kifunensis]